MGVLLGRCRAAATRAVVALAGRPRPAIQFISAIFTTSSPRARPGARPARATACASTRGSTDRSRSAGSGMWRNSMAATPACEPVQRRLRRRWHRRPRRVRCSSAAPRSVVSSAAAAIVVTCGAKRCTPGLHHRQEVRRRSRPGRRGRADRGPRGRNGCARDGNEAHRARPRRRAAAPTTSRLRLAKVRTRSVAPARRRAASLAPQLVERHALDRVAAAADARCDRRGIGARWPPANRPTRARRSEPRLRPAAASRRALNRRCSSARADAPAEPRRSARRRRRCSRRSRSARSPALIAATKVPAPGPALEQARRLQIAYRPG